MLRCVVLPILVLASSAGNVAAQAVCAVRGVWELESATDGEPRDLAGRKQMKIVTTRDLRSSRSRVRPLRSSPRVTR